jgi:hypothetical protein
MGGKHEWLPLILVAGKETQGIPCCRGQQSPGDTTLSRLVRLLEHYAVASALLLSTMIDETGRR